MAVYIPADQFLLEPRGKEGQGLKKTLTQRISTKPTRASLGTRTLQTTRRGKAYAALSTDGGGRRRVDSQPSLNRPLLSLSNHQS